MTQSKYTTTGLIFYKIIQTNRRFVIMPLEYIPSSTRRTKRLQTKFREPKNIGGSRDTRSNYTIERILITPERNEGKKRD